MELSVGISGDITTYSDGACAPGREPDDRLIHEQISENTVKEVPHNKHGMKEGPKSERGTDEHREKPLPVTRLLVARYHAPHRFAAEL